MDHLATASLLLKLTSIIFISSVSADPTNITAEPGQNVTLPCRAPDSNPVIAVEWSRKDLGPKFVLLYRNNHSDLEQQHPSFKNRVYLQEGQIKEGDVSLTVKNVSSDDRGTYKCLVVQTETNSRRKAVLYIHLDVVPPPGEPDDKNKDGLGLIVGLVVAAIFVAIIVLFICKILKKHKSTSNRPPGAVAGTEQCLMPPVSSA